MQEQCLLKGAGNEKTLSPTPSPTCDIHELGCIIQPDNVLVGGAAHLRSRHALHPVMRGEGLGDTMSAIERVANKACTEQECMAAFVPAMLPHSFNVLGTLATFSIDPSDVRGSCIHDAHSILV